MVDITKITRGLTTLMRNVFAWLFKNVFIWLWFSVSLIVIAVFILSAPASALAQTWTDLKCTGDTDIPWSEQTTGCSNAIASGTFTGKDLAVAFQRRGTAYASTGDFDHALVDYDQ